MSLTVNQNIRGSNPLVCVWTNNPQEDEMYMNKLSNDDRAVSPVIGVILMVAITVVLAAIVFVLVMNLSKQSASAPIEVGVIHNQDHTFTITSIAEKITWSNVTIKDNGITQTFTVNGLPPSGSITAGDVIKITGLTTGNHNVTMITRNQVFYSTSFVV